jgi:hypothetical protein
MSYSKDDLIQIIETHLKPYKIEWEDVGFGWGYKCPICGVEDWKIWDVKDFNHKDDCYWSNK